MWVECLENRAGIDAVFGVPPTFSQVFIQEVILSQGVPRILVRFDLLEFPDRPPQKWLKLGNNTVQIQLMLSTIESIAIAGWKSDEVVDFSLIREGLSLALTVQGDSTSIRGRFGFAHLDRISGYIRNDRLGTGCGL